MVRDQRRLAAVVSADVAGYSRLMGLDDSDTLARLKAHRRELIDPKIAEYGGRIVKTIGDGLLLEFPSVVDAVRCAVDVQRGMAERNADVPPEQRIEFRIGINVGDIIIDDDDIFGDGVNVAARVQALAEPGGICTSKVVRDQVLDKLNFTFEDLGAQQVKNIARPVEVYRVDLGSETSKAPRSGRRRWHRLTRAAGWRWLTAGVTIIGIASVAMWAMPRLWKPAAGPAPTVLSVAILPLTSARGDEEAAHLAETLTRNLTTELPHKREFGSVYVVSDSSLSTGAIGTVDTREVGRRLNVRYVLEGDVVRGSAGITVNLRLVDTSTAGQVWAEQDTLPNADVATESSAPLRHLVGRLQTAIIGIEGRRVTAMLLPSLSARELVLRAFELGGTERSVAGLAAAGKLVDEALRLEPDLVPALVLRAAIFNDQGDMDPHLDRGYVAREQDQLTTRAVRLDSNDPAAWNWRGVALANLGRWDAALDANALAIKLDPYHRRWQSFRSDIMVHAGRPAEALKVIDRALALDPSGSETLWDAACSAHLLAGQNEPAIAACEKASGLSNDWSIHVVLAAAYANQGNMTKANAARAEVLRTVPGFTIAQLRDKSPVSPEAEKLAEKYLYEGLRKAGFQEQ
ncbi:MAG: adenylate/guanylate cyclase domain-containing protein [Betaproteobacteria bacterium]